MASPINNTVTPGYVPLGTASLNTPTLPNFASIANQNPNALGTAGTPSNIFSGAMQTSTPQVPGLVNPTPHPAVAAAANSHPTTLTTNPDGTVKATYDTSNITPVVSTPSPSNPTSNPNFNYNAGVAPQVSQPGVPQLSNAGVSTAPSPASTTPTAKGLLSTVASFAQQDPQLLDLKNQMDALDTDYANRVANIQSTPTTLNEQTGRLAAIQSEYNSAKAALNSNYQSLLQSRGQNIGAAESALGTASTLTPSQYGQPLINPATGQTISGGQDITGTGSQGAIQPNDPAYASLQQYAQMAANGQISAIPSAWTSNPVINAQINAMAKAINPSYNPIASAAQGNVTASNIQAGGTTATSAAASGLQQATQNYVSANTAYTTAQNQSANLKQVLATTGINQNPQFMTSKINALANQFGSANYTSFITALTELQQKYTNLLSTVGAQTPTVNGQQATTILGPDSTPNQINAAIDALNNAAYAQLKPMYDQIGTYQSQLTSSNTTSNGTSANPWH